MSQGTFSYVSGASDQPLLGETIGQALERAIERWPERPALISPSHDVSWTWREFGARVRDLAAGFVKLGLKRGERIGVWSLNRPEWTLTQFAAAEAGLVFVTINPAYRLHELEYALNEGRLRRAGDGDALQDQRLHRHGQYAGARTRRLRARRAESGQAAGPAHRHPDRRERAGNAPLRGRGEDSAARPSAPRSPPCAMRSSSTIPPMSSSPRARRVRPRA